MKMDEGYEEMDEAMGEIADWQNEMDEDARFEAMIENLSVNPFRRIANKKKEYSNNTVTSCERYFWVTADGHRINLWDLKDSHILNILRRFPHAENVRAWAKFKGLI